MDQHNQCNSLLGDTSDFHLFISEEKQHLIASAGLMSGIINLQFTRTIYLLSGREKMFDVYLSSDDSDGKREVLSTPGYTVSQEKIFKRPYL